MTRRYLADRISSIKSQLARHEHWRESLIEVAGEQEYERVQKYYEKVIAKLSCELAQRPIGFRYTGIYFVKKPYSSPPEFVKCNGSIFMREDLVSWQIESGYIDDNQQYFRNIYTEPKQYAATLTRDDAVPVYREQTITA